MQRKMEDQGPKENGEKAPCKNTCKTNKPKQPANEQTNNNKNKPNIT